jgi:predicted Ser/Thr protein kinase
VDLVELDGKLYVRKTVPYVRVFGLTVAKFLSHWLARSEADALKVLEGIPGIPVFAKYVAPNAFVYEYIPGATLQEAQEVPDDFFDRLDETILEMHSRGVAHFNISRPTDVLKGEDGAPYLVDFEKAIVANKGKGLRRAFNTLLFKVGSREDVYHAAKMKVRYRPDRAHASGCLSGRPPHVAGPGFCFCLPEARRRAEKFCR